MTFQFTPSPSQGRFFARSVTPVIPDSSPSAAEVIELSSPLNPPSPLSLSRSLSTSTSCKPANLQTDEKNADGHGALHTRPGLENSPLRTNRSVIESKRKDIAAKKQGRRTESPANTTQTEIQIVNGDRLALSPKRPEKRGTKGPRAKLGNSSANKKLHGRVSKTREGGSVATQTKNLTPEDCDAALESFSNEPKDDLNWEEQGLQLEQATKRRLDWTPTKDIAIPIVNLVEDNSSPYGESSTGISRAGTLFSTYGYNGAVGALDGSKAEDVHDAPTTKRPMELLKIQSSKGISSSSEISEISTAEEKSNLSKKQRGKASQKSKLKTITSYATAKYSVADETADLDIVGDVLPGQSKIKSSTKGTSGTKRATSGKKSTTSKEKEEPPTFKVVPPLEAFKSFGRQEFLFGTSSQLENGDFENQEEATQSTSCPPNDPFTSLSLSSSESRHSGPSQTSIGSGLFGLSGSKNLWSASARDLSGAVLEVDKLDLTDTLAEPTKGKPVAQGPPSQNVVIIDDIGENTPTEIDPSSVVKHNKVLLEDDVLQKDTAETNAMEAASNIPPSPSKGSAERAVEEKPAFGGFTTSELAKKVAAYGFKPIKSRGKMISLLEKCWENQTKSNSESKSTQGDSEVQSYNSDRTNSSGSQTQRALITCKTNARFPNAKPAKPSAEHTVPNGLSETASKSGTKRTVSPAALVDSDQVDDPVEVIIPSSPIPDSHEDLTDLTPRAQRTKPEISPATPVTIRSKKPSNSGLVSTAPPSLSKQITEAIIAQPRLRAFNGVKQPTWHEKILMFDPIQLEDLAAWLNTDGFGRIGEDREVGPGIVRDWCESKGVCCVWKKQTGVRS
ncbi:hypothetical protein AJ79_09885 [Helicocarpus griseus UAMH5409]|uniref:Structure-specific endonuclease subunit SLX4 n=1 Tax=Helicocarpus griseus UAMH5409 TaxID=1447875 RepID=A0A2B7WGV1_9EURO|nr:hypothetical protein AJ79_09885 [Helicocarpus griseus UAMH5409]